MNMKIILPIEVVYIVGFHLPQGTGSGDKPPVPSMYASPYATLVSSLRAVCASPL